MCVCVYVCLLAYIPAYLPAGTLTNLQADGQTPMILTLLSFKGGVGKTTAAIHLAGWLNESAPTALSDGDNNRSALFWSRQGEGQGLPFKVADESDRKIARTHEHIVVDTPARPAPLKFEGLVQNADVLILVCEPKTLSLDALTPAIRELHRLNADFRVLLTRGRPHRQDAALAQRLLAKNGVPQFEHYVRDYIVADKAAQMGCLCRDVNDPHALDLWEDYGEIAQEILNAQK